MELRNPSEIRNIIYRNLRLLELSRNLFIAKSLLLYDIFNAYSKEKMYIRLDLYQS